MHPRSVKVFRRRGVAILAFVMALLVIGSFALWLFQLTAATSTSSLSHYLSMGAFYAAESGLEMAMRELNQSPPNDNDSDGTIGTISDNGNPADDPALVTGAVFVEETGSRPDTYQATGRPVQGGAPWTDFRRVVEVRIE